MFSICIPTYNTNCTRLLQILEEQLTITSKEIEVIVLDDGSSSSIANTNKNECQRLGFNYIQNKINTGRIQTRMRLANESSHSWLLFLDADMIPVRSDFIQTYYNNIIEANYDVYVGGHCYEKKRTPFCLRLNYGNSRENIDEKKRNNNPYNHIFFGNILIKKELFLSVFSTYSDPSYGEDIYLSAKLKDQKSRVLHLNNKTYHLGVETNAVFISKTAEAAATIATLFKDNKIDQTQSKLLKCYWFLQQNNLAYIVCIGLAVLKPVLKKCLLWFGKPLVFIDLYRLYYFLKSMKHGS